MASPEERLAGLEQQFTAVTQELQRTQQQNAELAEAVRQAQAVPQAARAAPPYGLGVDTRLLGKPPNFDGAEAKWNDWSVVVRGYCAITHPQLGALMAHVEATEADVPLRRPGRRQRRRVQAAVLRPPDAVPRAGAEHRGQRRRAAGHDRVEEAEPAV